MATGVWGFRSGNTRGDAQVGTGEKHKDFGKGMCAGNFPHLKAEVAPGRTALDPACAVAAIAAMIRTAAKRRLSLAIFFKILVELITLF